MDAAERTRLLLEFYAPERMHAQASAQDFVITLEMQQHAEIHGYDRLRADAANTATSNDDTASVKTRRGTR